MHLRLALSLPSDPLSLPFLSCPRTHVECFTVMRQMLDRETWLHVPMSVEALGGMAGVVASHTGTLAWPGMNGSG